MTRPWIHPGKLAPPTPAADWLARPVPRDGSAAPVTLLVGGPGDGKTVALRGLLGDGPGVWYAMDEGDADPVEAMQHLLAGVRAHIPDFALEIDAWLVDGAPDAKRVWARFFQALGAFNMPAFTFAMDDVHHFADANPAWIKALAYHFDKLPPGTRLLLASRRRLAVPLERLRLRGLVAAIDPDELRFNPEEVAGFLRQRAPDDAVLATWTRRAAALGGWPLGLHLVARGGAVDATEASGYITDELVNTQEPGCRAFMARAAVLGEVTAAGYHAVFGGDDATRWLEDLEAQGLLQRRADGGYRFPTYLREVLLAEVARTVPLIERQGWHVAAGQHALATGRPADGLPHLLAAGDWAGAIAAGEVAFPAAYGSGRHGQLTRWIAAFPAAIAEAEPAVAYWHGRLLARAGHATQAREATERAARQFASRDDNAGELRALTRLCALAAYDRDARTFGRHFGRAQALLPAGTAADQADLQLARGLLADQRGDMDLVLACNEAVLALGDDRLELASSVVMARLNLATLALHRGELPTARAHLAAASELATTHGLVPAALWARFLAAHLDGLADDRVAAGAFLRGLDPTWRDVLDWQDRACAETILGHHHRLEGEIRPAEEALQRSLDAFERAGFAEGAKIPLEQLLWLAIQRGQRDRVAQLAERAGQLGHDSMYDLALQLPLAWARHLGGEDVAALWPPILDGLARAGARLALARARLYQAAATDHGTAEAVAAAISDGYGFLVTQDPTLAERLVVARPAEVGVTAPAGATLRCFGGFEVVVDGERRDAWPRRRAKVLFAALALYPRGLTAESLAEALGTEDPGQGSTLRVLVASLRKVLDPANGARFVRSTADGYVLDAEALPATDLRAFEAAIALAERERANPEQAARHYAEAVAVYRGNLLEEPIFLMHFEAERRKYQQEVLRALVFLADHHAKQGDAVAAERQLRRACELAPCEEEIYLRMMRHHHQAGEPARVRQTYWDYRRALKARLGLEPDPAFDAAFAALS